VLTCIHDGRRVGVWPRRGRPSIPIWASPPLSPPHWIRSMNLDAYGPLLECRSSVVFGGIALSLITEHFADLERVGLRVLVILSEDERRACGRAGDIDWSIFGNAVYQCKFTGAYCSSPDRSSCLVRSLLYSVLCICQKVGSRVMGREIQNFHGNAE